MLYGKAIAVSDLSAEQRKKMLAIMQEHYDNLRQGTFYADLAKKQDAVLLCDEQGEIHGFTTLAAFDLGGGVQYLFSGDTIVEKAYWANHNLPQAWLANALKRAGQYDGKSYWLLLSKGYKTYKYAHTFFHEFYPRYDKETPEYMQALMDTFAAEQFGEKYYGGIYHAGKDFLKSEYADISPAKLQNKNTAFFLERNPGYRQGDELVCIAELSVDNLNSLGRKLLR